MTLVNNVSSFIIDVCNTRHCCCEQTRCYSTFIYICGRKTHSLSFFSGKREKRREMGGWVCVSYYYFAVRPDKSCARPERMTFGHSLCLSKLIETWTGARRWCSFWKTVVNFFLFVAERQLAIGWGKVTFIWYRKVVSSLSAKEILDYLLLTYGAACEDGADIKKSSKFSS